jgi:selenocysteine-specific elongation factor
LPENLDHMPYDQVQFTLVDCPGHATLMKTVLGGAHIIDMMVLVIDVNKGMQTQTAECLVVGEITTHDLLVVLNKIDMIPEKMRFERIEKLKRV